MPHDLARLIRDIPDYPKPGIVFKDITPLLADPAALQRACRLMAEPFVGTGVTHVAAIESRGFLFGAPIALTLGAGLVPLRKAGKLPHKTSGVSYELEYGSDRIEVHSDALDAHSRVLLVDDVLATGGTAAAACELILEALVADRRISRMDNGRYTRAPRRQGPGGGPKSPFEV